MTKPVRHGLDRLSNIHAIAFIGVMNVAWLDVRIQAWSTDTLHVRQIRQGVEQGLTREVSTWLK